MVEVSRQMSKMELLNRYYNIRTLKDWLNRRSDGDMNITVLLDTDTQSYKTLLTSVYVCEDSDRCPLPGVLLSHYYEQRELILNAIERILCKKGYGKNILTYGFCLMSPDPFAHSCGVNVESRYPNSCVNRLFYPAWETLLSRIGDTLMMYLLEHTSLFLQITPTCLVQITGTPIHNLSETAVEGNTKKFHKVQKVWNGNDLEQKNVDRIMKNECTVGEIGIGLEQLSSKHKELDSKENKEEFASGTGTKGGSDSLVVLETETDIEHGRNRQTGEDRKHIFLTKNENLMHRTIYRSCSKNGSLKTNLEATGKKKRKFEDISEDRFQKLKRESEKYAKSSRQKTDDHISNTHDDLEDLDVRTEENQADDVVSRKEIYPRKRKFSEVSCTDSEIEVCMQMGKDTKRRCLENKYKRNIEDVTNTGNTKGDETMHDIVTPEAGHNLDVTKIENKKSVFRTLKKIRNKRKKTKRKNFKISEERNKSKSSFCPFEYHLPVPRNNVLFSRNPRERLPKSVLLSKLDSTIEDTLLLYKDIFHETKVFRRSEVQATYPDLHEMRRALNIPDKGLNLTQDSKIPRHSFVNSFQTSNRSCENGHPSFWNDSTGNKMGTTYLTCTFEQAGTSRQVSINQSCRDLSSCSKSKNCSLQSVVTNDETGDLEGTCKSKPSSEMLDSCKFKVDNALAVGKCENGIKERVKSCEKETLLVKRKCEILRRRKVELNHFATGDSIKTNTSVVDDGIHFDIPAYGDNIVSAVSLQDNRFTQGDRIKSVVSVEGNSKDCHCDGVVAGQCGGNGVDFECQQQKQKSSSTNVEYIRSSLGTGRPGMSFRADKHPAVTEASAFNCEEKNSDGKTEDQAYVCSSQPTEVANTQTIEIPIMPEVILLLKQFIERHRRCPYRALLNHHCPIICKKAASVGYLRKRQGLLKRRGNYSVSELLSNHHHHRKVYLFLRACILKVMPVALIGTKHNLNILLKNVSKMISLGKYDRLTLGQLMYGIKTTQIDWLTDASSNSVRLHVLAKLMLWLCGYVLVLLKTYFYITDTGFLRYRLVYYRQTTWNKLHSQGFKGLINRKILKTVSEKKVLELLQSKTSLGVSLLRFLPKPQSLRPITNMGNSLLVNSWQTHSVNKQILDLHSVMTYLKNRNPSIIGHGKLGTNDIYKSWKSLVGDWKKSDCPKLYFVKTDISNCYDSIRQNKLYAIMEDILKKEMNDEEFIIRKYFTVGIKDGNMYRKFHRDVTPMSEFNPDFSSFCTQKANKEKLKNVIFVDKVVYQHETCESLLKLLKSHLFNNLIKVGNHYCLQTSGISQGSVISTLLCSFYYADMERSLFKFTAGEFLMRIVDDYLYVTPSQEQAVTFLNTMIRGVPEYHCCTNKEKILTSFMFEHNDGILPMVSIDWFPWCGIFINTRTLEISMDFTKYSGSSIKDTMTVELSKTPGKSLKDKLLL
ncbi:uncharacterized protein LOC123531834 isoform X2 [Mercenaria mercenaria]|uniref:uncharacterized protein LOC123531834 isoform X2 n=1 Tax=Mercenaria mercenaria TaxID=6596 RepID=UPI00234E6352|nr:uncharacterized protein LOC123531834 isoform X2 [Mercenaria mercenaria]